MKLEPLRGLMAGNDCLVVGCGPSAQPAPADWWRETQPYRANWTIGCNRATTYCAPDFAVCVEPRRDRTTWDLVCASSPFLLFSHVARDHPRAVTIGSKDVREWLEPGKERRQDPAYANPLRLGQSPFYAAAVAILLGFETIGLIGVDLTADRYDDAAVKEANTAYGRLARIADAMGSRIVNLNPTSELRSVSLGTWDDVRAK